MPFGCRGVQLLWFWTGVAGMYLLRRQAAGRIPENGAYQDNQFELEILGETVPFVLDEELRKDNYKRHFEICDRIMDLLREQKLI